MLIPDNFTYGLVAMTMIPSRRRRSMTITCPNCKRSYSDAGSADDSPSFCMHCGAKLRGGTAAETKPALSKAKVVITSEDFSATADAVIPQADSSQLEQTAVHPDFGRRQPGTAGEVIGGYLLKRVLGSGGMGTVYEAESPSTGRRVAVKLLSNRLASHASSVERFRQEGRVASQITHPHCVFVLRADTDAGRPYIVMELMPGKTLKDLVDQRGTLPVGEAIDRILDVIDGLNEAHRLGVIHRDVKPSNCFLTADDRVKIGDFGLSKSFSLDRENRNLTQTGHFLGTVLYAPPEQIRGESVSYDSDIYAVCATLYFLLTGRSPFQHESLTAALAKAVSEPPTPIRKYRPDVPTVLERVIVKGLDRDRQRRWVSLQELRDALVELHPDHRRPARPRVMSVAYSFDAVLLVMATTIVEFIMKALFGSSAGALASIEYFVLVSTLYFTIFDGIIGWSPGKRLLRLRTAKVGSTGPPGIRAGFFRSAVFALMWFAVFSIPARLTEPLGPIGLILGLGISMSGLATLLLCWVCLGFGGRGVHDFASECLVLQLQPPTTRVTLVGNLPNPLDRLQPASGPLPVSVGGFIVRGKLTDLPDGGEAWSGTDEALGRRVIIRILPLGKEEPMISDAVIARPTRLRMVSHGAFTWNGHQRVWLGYVAPGGTPLKDVIDSRGPLEWNEALPLLEQLVAELRATDGDSVHRPIIEQLWVEPGGRLQLLDFPLPTGSQDRLPQEPGSLNPNDLIRLTTSLILEGAPRQTEGRVRAPLPSHAAKITDRIFKMDGYPQLEELAKDLTESRQHGPRVTVPVRVAHLSIQGVMLSLGLSAMLVCSTMYHFVLALGAAQMSRTYVAAREMLESDDQRKEYLSYIDDEFPNDPLRSKIEPLITQVDQARRIAGQSVRVIDIQRQITEDEIDHMNRVERQMWNGLQSIVGGSQSGMNSGVGRNEVRDNFDGMTPGRVSEFIVLCRNEKDLEQVMEKQARDAGRGLFTFLFCVVFGFPLIWSTFAFLFHGGISMQWAGIAIVRGDGRTAGRFLCAVRELLAWSPFTLALLCSMLLQFLIPDRVLLRTGLWLIGVMMLPLYVAIALRIPTRPPHDRILGTSLVPD